MKRVSMDLQSLSNSRRLLSRDERKKILGGTAAFGCAITEMATTSHDCDGPDPNDPCGIDKDKEGGGVCCLSCDEETEIK